MKPEDWDEINRLFNAARELEPENRAPFLAKACAGREFIRKEVEDLIKNEDEHFLENPPVIPMSNTEPLFQADSVISNYRILKEIGRGGMGVVYSAIDLNLDCKVALKFLHDEFIGDPERIARFEREAKLLASLNHPNIATIHRLEQAEDKRFIVMELVEGETLAERLMKGPLPLEEAMVICGQIAEALEAAHEKGVIHRDLKPANVMIAEGERVKVLDFGIAKALSGEMQSTITSQSSTTTEPKTQPWGIIGTPAYMSPEHICGRSVDKRTDIWAFGCVLYECLTGKRAFEGETDAEIIAAVLTSEPDWEKIPVEILPLLRWCLKKDPKKRLRDVGDAIKLVIAPPPSHPTGGPGLWRWIVATSVLFVTTLVLFLISSCPKPPTGNPWLVEILPPKNVTMDWGASFALSPDGNHLVFSAAGADGAMHLYIRDSDSLEPKPLPDTESDHFHPFFWSPDSRFIAWGTGGKLKKIDIAGGPVQTICDIDDAAIGGSWNRDGMIIFASYQEPLLKHVRAEGGVASPLTKPDPSRRVTRQRAPNFLPDGRHFLYWQDSDVPKNRGVYIGSLDSKPEEQDSMKLLDTEFWPCVYVPPRDSGQGHILFIKDRNLMAQQFDDKRMKLAGAAMPVADHLGSFSGGGFFSASTNGILVYRGGGATERQEMVWLDRSGKQLEKACLEGEFRNIMLSPDETKIIFQRTDKSNKTNEDIWVRDLHSGFEQKLTRDSGVNYKPIWSPDGLGIVYSSDRILPTGLFIMPANGVGQAELLFKINTAYTYATDWSRDGKFILYLESGKKGAIDIWTTPQFGDKQRRPYLQSPFNKDNAVFSPDAHWIAYMSKESERWEIYVQAFPLTGERKPISNRGGFQPVWRKDGTELFYLSGDGKLMAVPIQTNATSFRPGTAKALFPLQRPLIASSADGRRFLVSMPVREAVAAPFTVVVDWQDKSRRH
jgi:eukaryotic-like serine/threonine-protein kinase